MRFSVRTALGTLLALFAAGCGTEPLSFGSLGTEPLSFGNLVLRLDVHPAQVSAADSFTVRLVVRNVGVQDTTLTSGCSVPTFFGLDGPGGVVYPAPGFGCYTVITPFRIAAGDSLTMTRRFVAQDPAKHGQPALPPGEYVLFTDWQIWGLPVLRQSLSVIESPNP
jgi:hypothetical protein